MEKFRGTPGPWEKKVRPSKTGRSQIMAIIPKYYGERRLETVLHLGTISDDDCGVETCCCIEEHANARLIAAAPELLEALQAGLWAIGYFQDVSPEYKEQYKNAVKAINKALGI